MVRQGLELPECHYLLSRDELIGSKKSRLIPQDIAGEQSSEDSNFLDDKAQALNSHTA